MKLIPLFILVLFLVITIPVQAIEINPSVETIPWTCRYDVVKWALCQNQIPGMRGINGTPGPQGLPNFSAIFYNVTNSTITQNSSVFVNVTNSTINSNYSVFEGTTFDSADYAKLSGRPGGQTLTGGTTTGNLVLNGSANNGNVMIVPAGGSVITGNQTQSQTILGDGAGYQNTGTYQTAVGYSAGYQNTGTQQTATGGYAGYKNTGTYQTVVGYYTGYQNTGTYQTAVGYSAGYQNTGTQQTATGSYAGYKNTGTYQTATGYGAGYQNTGTRQTATGGYAGYQNTGTYQTATGGYAGYGNTGNSLVAIGYYAGANNSAHNQFILKQNNVNTNPLISGNFSSGIVTFNNYGAGTLTTDAGGNITVVSDEKMKTAIRPYTGALAAIKAIQPITYKYNAASGLDTQNVYTGFSAQNLKTAIPEAVYTKEDVVYVQETVKGADGEVDITTSREVKTGTTTLSISDRPIIATLVNAVKEQQATITALQEENKKMNERITALEKRLEVKP